jgi:SAM-dependent methyltransferase
MTDGFRGTTGRRDSWEATYREIPAAELPWNAGSADGDLQGLLAAGAVPKGRAFDLGCGPGNDAAFLAGRGWSVTAVDIAPSAVALARKRARQEGVEEKIRFVVGDVLDLKAAKGAALVHDRGCFHTLPSELWKEYSRVVGGLLAPGGVLALKVFSHKEPAGRGPYRFREAELRKVFGDGFECLSIRDAVFHGPALPKALFCVFRKAKAAARSKTKSRPKAGARA